MNAIRLYLYKQFQGDCIYLKKKMSSSLIPAAREITKWIVPIVLTLGVVANVLNIVILRRRKLKQHSCTLYFVALSINNLIYLCICVISNLFNDGFGISLDSRSNDFCKFNTYLLNLCPQIAVYMLVLASIDRYCSSSINARLRRLSNIRIAQWSIGIAVLFALVFIVNTAIIVSNANAASRCVSDTSHIINQILRVAQVVVYVIIAPLLMIIFGLLTIHNATRFNREHAAAVGYRPSERQLTRMLIIQVLTHIILSLPFCVIFFMTIIPLEFKSTIMFFFLFLIFKIPLYITFITPFFLYILTAQLYRSELILLVKKIFRIRANIVQPMRTQPLTAPTYPTH